mmetsp:Transcript_24494/g.73109  ORF Transcript_24494/g.73109 Transcript_24494/m.73109 type:complete len:230 (+) Transcript_24494:1248-1937(+)
MSRAAPLRTSPASCSRVLAEFFPKRLGSMLCSVSMRENIRRSLASPATSAATVLFPPTSKTPERSMRLASHHSYRFCAPDIWRSGTTNSLTWWCALPGFGRREVVVSRARALCSRSRRFMSSWRRSRTPASAPSCTMSSPSSRPSGDSPVTGVDDWAATQGCDITVSEEGRMRSFFSSILRMNSSQVGCTRLGMRTSLLRTSFSSRKGKRPLTRPYMMTPIPQTSTLAP